MKHFLTIPAAIVFACAFACSTSAAALTADHNSANDFADIPMEYFDQIRADFSFFYGHTSHGSQIISGIGMLSNENYDLYNSPDFYEVNDDLGYAGDISWVQPTRDYLDLHPECSIAMWSWCGGASDNTEAGTSIYLEAMESLEADYPSVIFVYMTGHLNGTGIDGNLYRTNNQIRDYCTAHGKVLYDFADIESYDPDGVYYPDDTDACNWCVEWCAVPEHDCPPSYYCAHSDCFNCYRKGKAFWWMMARLSGWAGFAAVGDPVQSATILHLEANFPNPFNPRTTISFRLEENALTVVDIFDLQGRHITTIHDTSLEAGRHEIVWEGRSDAGLPLSSGNYFCRVRAGDETAVQTMTLLK